MDDYGDDGDDGFEMQMSDFCVFVCYLSERVSVDMRNLGRHVCCGPLWLKFKCRTHSPNYVVVYVLCCPNKHGQWLRKLKPRSRNL